MLFNLKYRTTLTSHLSASLRIWEFVLSLLQKVLISENLPHPEQLSWLPSSLSFSQQITSTWPPTHSYNHSLHNEHSPPANPPLSIATSADGYAAPIPPLEVWSGVSHIFFHHLQKLKIFGFEIKLVTQILRFFHKQYYRNSSLVEDFFHFKIHELHQII